MRYVQIDSEGYVISDSNLSGKVDRPDMIPVPRDYPSVIGKKWTGTEWEDLPEPEPEPEEEAEPIPMVLSKYDFIMLCQAAGGMTEEMTVNALKNEPELEYFWLMLDLQESFGIRQNDPQIEAGLAAMAVLGYLPDGAQAVLDAWPIE